MIGMDGGGRRKRKGLQIIRWFRNNRWERRRGEKLGRGLERTRSELTRPPPVRLPLACMVDGFVQKEQTKLSTSQRVPGADRVTQKGRRGAVGISRKLV